MSDITQSFGLDASSTLTALKELDAGFARLDSNINKLAATLQNFNGTGAKVSSTAKAVGNAFKSNMGAAAAATNQLSTSWNGLVSRVVLVQGIVRALSTLRNTLQDAAADAITLQKRMAEIQTISPGSSVAGLSAEVRELSDSFNIPILDVAKSKYEALSNGFTTASQQADVLAASFKFSKVALTDSADSLDLITGTLNAYNLKSDQAEAISAKFFKTIELGRVTGAQLAHSLGQVAPAAAAVGVGLDEVLSQFATLTQGGLSPEESATQISATLSALIKPSEAASNALEKLGFSSAESAIAANGFNGTIKALVSTTDGSAAAIAKLFPNIRALKAVLRVGPAEETLASFLKQIEGIDTSKFNAIVGKSLQTDAERVTAEVNKLTNALTVDLGNALLEDVAGLAKLTGGMDNVISGAKTLSPLLKTGAGLLAAYAFAAYSGAFANAAFATSFAGVASGLALVAGAAAGGNLIGNQLNERVGAEGKALEKAAQERLAALKQSEAERLSALAAADDKRLAGTQKTIAELNKAYLDDVSNAEAAAKLLIKNADRTADAIDKSREKLAASFENAAKASRQLEKDSANRITDLQQRSEDRRFDRSLNGKSDAQQVFALSQRASDLANKAAADLAKAAASGDKVGIDRATALFNKAQGLGESAEEIGKRAGNRALEVRAAQGLESITAKQVQAELKLQAIQDQRQAALDALNKKQLSALETVREQTEIVRKNANILDDKGNLLPEDEIAKRQAASAAALAKLRQSGLSAEDLKAADKAGLGDKAREFNLKLAQQTVTLDFEVTGGIQRIKGQLQQSFENFKLKLGVDVDALQENLGRVFKNPDEVARGIDEVKKKAADLRTALSQAKFDDVNIRQLKAQLKDITTALDSTSRTGLRFLGVGGRDEQQQVADLSTELELLARNGAVSSKQIEEFFGKVASLKDKVIGTGNVANNFGLGLDIQDLATAAGLLKQLQSAQQSAANNPGLGGQAELKNLDALIAELETANPATAFQSAATAIGQGADGSAAIANNFKRAADDAERAAKAAASINGPDRTGKALGGVALAAGGQAKGTDTVPAMLSPGEFVVNSRSARQWFPQLQAINAGQAPSVSNNSSETVNVQVGDIVVNSPGDGQLTARMVVDEINRMKRRGVARLR